MNINNTGTIQQTNKVRLKDLTFSSKDVFLSISMFIMGFLYWDLIQIWSMGLGVTIFFFVLTILITIYLKASGFKQNISSIICNVLIYITATNFFIFDNLLIKILAMIWMIFLSIYWVALFTGRTIGKGVSIYSIGDCCQQIFVTPFVNFIAIFDTFIYRNTEGKDGERGKKFLHAILGLLVFLPILITVIVLLSSADPTFDKIVSQLFDIKLPYVLRATKELIFGIPVAMYICGSLIGNVYNRYATCSKDNMDKMGKSIGFASNTAINAALAAFCVIYVMFIVVQVINLVNGINGDLPGKMTYAEYARHGFFQLCFVVGINLIVCIIAYAFTRCRESKVFRSLFAAMSLATILLSATAMAKMMIYIKCYGLTQMRVYVSWFIVLLMLMFLVVFIRQVIKFNGTKVLAIIFAVCFTVLIFGNVDGQIAKYNMARYEEGTLKMMDYHTLNSLSNAAVPYVYEAYKNADDKKTKNEICKQVSSRYGVDTEWFDTEDPQKEFKAFNLQKYKGEKLVKKKDGPFIVD